MKADYQSGSLSLGIFSARKGTPLSKSKDKAMIWCLITNRSLLFGQSAIHMAHLTKYSIKMPQTDYFL